MKGEKSCFSFIFSPEKRNLEALVILDGDSDILLSSKCLGLGGGGGE